MSLLKDILVVLALLFTNPLVPDWGLHLVVATAMGMLLPHQIVNPLDRACSRISGMPRFISFLSKNRSLHQIIPRIIAGYVVIYLIGWTSLVIAHFIPSQDRSILWNEKKVSTTHPPPPFDHLTTDVV